MRTLKKTLALVLVVAMMLSFGVIGANAAFTDVTKTTKYAEEVTVLNALGVINGMTDTTFAPDGTLTREQAAKIIAYVKLGPTNAKLIGSASSSRFSDVAADRWSAGYIEYCANLGIIAGVGGGKFDPEGKLTTAAFTKMLLVAVGFDSTKYVGDGWAINVATDAIKAGINDDGIAVSATAEITRAQASRLAYLAMFYSTTTSTVTKYVASKQGSDVKMTFDSFIEAYLYAGETGTITTDKVEVKTDSLATKVFAVTRGEGVDSFGRPARTYTKASWTTPLSFAKTPTTVYTAAQSATAMAKAYTGYTFQGSGSSAAAIATATGNGKTVEIYTTGKNVDAVVVIAPEFVQVSVANVAASKLRGAFTQYDVTLSGGTAKSGRVYSTVVNATNDVDSAVVVGTIKNGDMALAYTNTAGTVLYLEAVTTVSGILSSISSSGLVTIGGKGYEMAAAGSMSGMAPNKDAQTFYVDSFGYVLGLKGTATASANYAFVIDSKTYAVLEDNKVVTKEFAVIALPDGTVKDAPLTAALAGGIKGTARTYTVSATGYYTFNEITGTAIDGTAGTTRMKATATAIANKGAQMTGDSTSLINDSTVFVFVDFKSDGTTPTGTVTTYVGKNNVPSISAVTAGKIVAIDTDARYDQVANVVYVNATTSAVVSDSYVYVIGSYTATTAGYVYDVIKGGALTTLTVSAKITVGGVDAKQVLLSSVTNAGGACTAATTTTDSIQNVGGLLFIDGAYSSKTITSATPVYVIDKYDDTVVARTFADITIAVTATDSVYVVENNNVIAAVYVVVTSA